MDAILTSLDGASGLRSLLFVILLLGILNAALTYFKEKGKNLATKEDIKELTQQVEAVKFEFENKGQMQTHQRQLYAELAASTRIFLPGTAVTVEAQDRFLASYNTAWLWASDKVLDALNEFLQEQVKHAAGAHNQEELKDSYSRFIVSMRNDATAFTGMTTRKPREYKLIHF